MQSVIDRNIVMWHLSVDDMLCLWKPKYVRSLQITVLNILSTTQSCQQMSV